MDSVPQRLAELLETLSTEERREITAWFFGRQGQPGRHHWIAGPDLPASAGLTSSLPAGEANQLVTIRLPADRHAELRTWCTDHGFTMAAVVRGLVERFLDEQRPKTA
jgi:hypothetical protein